MPTWSSTGRVTQILNGNKSGSLSAKRNQKTTLIPSESQISSLKRIEIEIVTPKVTVNQISTVIQCVIRN